MAVTLTGTFGTRREVEMAVERLVQEHGLDRSLVRIMPEGADNSSGERSGGRDASAGGPTSPARAEAALAGEIAVSVEVLDDDEAEKVRSSFAEFHADAFGGSADR